MENELINALKERAKELNCLYQIQELLKDQNRAIIDVFKDLVEIIPPGWQYPDICCARINYKEEILISSKNFVSSKWVLNSDILVQDETVGSLEVFYSEERPLSFDGPFLKEEIQLIKTITDQIGAFLLFKQLKSVFENKPELKKETSSEWVAILDLLRKTDKKLLTHVSRKMVNYLCWRGIDEAENLFDFYNSDFEDAKNPSGETNSPFQLSSNKDSKDFIDSIYKVAQKHLEDQEILDHISRWIKHDQSNFLVDIMGNMGAPLDHVYNVLERFQFLKNQGLELTPVREKNLIVSLLRRFLSEHHDFLKTAKKYFTIDNITELISKTVYPKNSYGKLGGKSAGLLLADLILKKSEYSTELTKKIKIPRTWYIASDALMSFMKYNSLEDITEQKYKDIQQVRKEYPFVTHVFKNSSFPPEISKGLSGLLDEFNQTPLVVRSTSLLEDRQNSLFAGKYKSLFISNQGTKEERLKELLDAISEVYASTFGPDPIEYRFERDLLDENEEMGIMIQEVVGKAIGDYFFPAYAGVAFSENNYRWSGRINSEDGLVRMVPGLGTRAVDRLTDDYPILFSPGKPDLKVNSSIEEIIRYAPKKMDVINLKSKKFETIKIEKILQEVGLNYPKINQLVSSVDGNYLKPASKFNLDFEKEFYLMTFDSLIRNTDLVDLLKEVMGVLESEFEYPVDIEFASDGEDFYLLQCRPQSSSANKHSITLPENIDPEKIVFSANKYVTNGFAKNISHLVYVDPLEYKLLQKKESLLDVGKAISRLNKQLPKKQFMLIGPGRWGSRGDIKLGVNVTYSDISNTAVLVEHAGVDTDFEPELSFGTHFFQDLVEAGILYVPLYPNEDQQVFKKELFTSSENVLKHLVPEYSFLENVIKVIDISSEFPGELMTLAMNGDEEKALAYIGSGDELEYENIAVHKPSLQKKDQDFHWRWRSDAAEQIVKRMEIDEYGIKGVYIFGSTKNATSSIGSDIDLLFHIDSTNEQKEKLIKYLKGWEDSLLYNYYLRTGAKLTILLDLHFITDEDIARRDSFAIKIGAVTDAARPLYIRNKQL